MNIRWGLGVLLCVSACIRSYPRYVTGDLVITPLQATVAPGDTLLLHADGCGAGCTFSFGGDGAKSGADAQLSSDGNGNGAYQAGSTGSVVDVVRVDNGTAQSEAQITITAALALSLSSTKVAPGETVVLAAGGGKPPYRFNLISAPSGAELDPITGLYRAGATGSVTDSVQVEDANQKQVTVALEVSSVLTAALEVPSAKAGVANRLVPQGGLAPFAFSFQPKGNRSRGTIDAITGVYVPGPNILTEDLLRVTDATGATADVSVTLPTHKINVGYNYVGNLYTKICSAGDIDRDRRDDLVLVSEVDRRIARAQLGQPVQYLGFDDAYPIGNTLDIAVGDFTSDASPDLAVRYNGEILIYPGSSQGFGAALPPLPVGYYSIGGLVISNRTLYYAAAFDKDASAPVGCRDGTKTYLLSLKDGETPVCLATHDDNAVSASWPRIMDINGDGKHDLVYVDDAVGGVMYTFLLDVHGTPSPKHITGASGGVSMANKGEMLRPAAEAGGYHGFIGVDDTFAHNISVRCTDATCDAMTAYDLGDINPDGVGGASFYFANVTPFPGSRGETLSWQDFFSPVDALSFNDPTGTTFTSRELFPDTISLECLTALDANGDGIADLGTMDAQSTDATIYLGEGDGSYGRRPRFVGFEPPVFADFDGDHVSDMVALEAGAFLVMMGDAHALAFTQRYSLSAQPNAFTVGAAGPSGEASLFYAPADGFGILEAPISAQGEIGEPVQMAITGNLPLVRHLKAIDLGGAAPGPDLTFITPRSPGWLPVVVMRDSVGGAHTISTPDVPAPAIGSNFDFDGSYAMVDLDADGQKDFVLLDIAINEMRVFQSLATGGGYGAWTRRDGSPSNVGAQLADHFSALGGAGNHAVLLYVPGSMAGHSELWTFTATGALARTQIPLPAPSDEQVAVTGRRYRYGMLAHMNTDTLIDLVVGDGVGLVDVYAGTGGGSFALGAPIRRIRAVPARPWAMPVLATGSAPDLFLVSPGIRQDLLQAVVLPL